MEKKLQDTINFFGRILTVVGAVLFAIIVPLEAMRVNPISFLVGDQAVLVGDILMSFAVVFILTGFVLALLEIMPSERKKDRLDVLRLRYVLGEITKTQYEHLMKESETSRKTQVKFTSNV